MNRKLIYNSILTFIVLYLIYRCSRILLDIFFVHYRQWTGEELGHLSGPIVLAVMIIGIVAFGLARYALKRRKSSERAGA